MMKIVATNVVASRPPERRPTATPTARAKMREYFPEPVNPTDRTFKQRSRLGLMPSKTIEQFGMNKIIMSNLVVTRSSEDTKEYFKNTFVEAPDQEKVIEVDAEKVTNKEVLVVTLRTKQECSIFKNKYEEKVFNGPILSQKKY